MLCTDISRDGMLARAFRGTIPANPEGVPEYASDSQRRSKLYTGHYRPGNSQSSGCCFRQGIIRGKNYIERLKPFHVRANHVSKKNHTFLDIKDGQTVKGTNFVNLRQAGDPVELGRTYSEQGADELVFLDITASHEGRKTFTDLVKRVAANINIPFTVGGGINKLSDVDRLLNAGADKVSINSSAIRNPDLVDKIPNISVHRSVLG